MVQEYREMRQQARAHLEQFCKDGLRQLMERNYPKPVALGTVQVPQARSRSNQDSGSASYAGMFGDAFDHVYGSNTTCTFEYMDGGLRALFRTSKGRPGIYEEGRNKVFEKEVKLHDIDQIPFQQLPEDALLRAATEMEEALKS